MDLAGDPPLLPPLPPLQVLAIEDPFELSHNLGSGLSRRMWLYIQRCLARARDHFGLPSTRLPNGANNLQVNAIQWD